MWVVFKLNSKIICISLPKVESRSKIFGCNNRIFNKTILTVKLKIFNYKYIESIKIGIYNYM